MPGNPMTGTPMPGTPMPGTPMPGTPMTGTLMTGTPLRVRWPEQYGVNIVNNLRASSLKSYAQIETFLIIFKFIEHI
jgi:hypothetical protein